MEVDVDGVWASVVCWNIMLEIISACPLLPTPPPVPSTEAGKSNSWTNEIGEGVCTTLPLLIMEFICDE